MSFQHPSKFLSASFQTHPSFSHTLKNSSANFPHPFHIIRHLHIFIISTGHSLSFPIPFPGHSTCLLQNFYQTTFPSNKFLKPFRFIHNLSTSFQLSFRILSNTFWHLSTSFSIIFLILLSRPPIGGQPPWIESFN